MAEKKNILEKIKDSKFAEFVREKVKPVAGDVLEIVGDVTGVQAIERVGELLNKRKEDNDQVRALDAEFQKYRLQWELEVQRIEIQAELDSFKLEVQDRESARGREVEFMKASGGKRDWLMGVVVITGLLLTVGVVAALIFWKVPEENQRLADMCFGSILSIGASIFAYYVGSSRGSALKDKTIHSLKQ